MLDKIKFKKELITYFKVIQSGAKDHHMKLTALSLS